MFYPLFSRLVPPQLFQNASHHIRYTKEIPGDKSQWSWFNYDFLFALAKTLVYVHSFQTYTLAENGKMMGCRCKCLEVLPYCLENIFTGSQRTERRKALMSCCSNTIRKFFMSWLIRAHIHFTVTHQGRAAHWDAITHKNNVKKFTGKT